MVNEDLKQFSTRLKKETVYQIHLNALRGGQTIQEYCQAVFDRQPQNMKKKGADNEENDSAE